MKRKNLQELIERAKKVHNNFYDYSEIVDYKGIDAKNKIICPIHGPFEQSFYNHINKKCGCKKCGIEKTRQHNVLPIQEVKDRIKSYGYDLPDDFKYANNSTKIKLICKKHGEFTITPNLLFRGERCKKCSFEKVGQKLKISNEEFIRRINNLYGDKLDTSITQYDGVDKKVSVICKKHGLFQTTPYSLYQGISCNECKKETLRKLKLKSQEQFLEESNAKYGDELMMDKVHYVDENTPILVGCKIHGYFWQSPRVHLKGNGCPLCKKSVLERHMETFLKRDGISYVQEYKVPNSLLRLDFYLPKYNCAIECQGKQHFEEVDHFGGAEHFAITHERDARKKKLCNENGIQVFYYAESQKYKTFLNEKVFNDFHELISAVKISQKAK